MIDLEKSKSIAKEIDAKKNMCHYNVFKGKIFHPELKRFLGYVVKDEYVTVHSWLQRGDNIIDPTLILNPSFIGDRYIGQEIAED